MMYLGQTVWYRISENDAESLKSAYVRQIQPGELYPAIIIGFIWEDPEKLASVELNLVLRGSLHYMFGRTEAYEEDPKRTKDFLPKEGHFATAPPKEAMVHF